MSEYHIPVLLKETLDLLDIEKGQWYIDCNLGGGGHTSGILALGGKVLGIDLDNEAIKEVALKHNLKIQQDTNGLYAVSDNLILVQTNFANLKDTVSKFQLQKIHGVLFDLGVSTHQLEEASRGFSFNLDAKLDMRMNPMDQVTAADLINGLGERELADLFFKLGEERLSRKIAKAIVERRKQQKIQTTDELAQIILSVRHRTTTDKTHPATRVFQALRIAVNDELNSLREALPQALEVLELDGRLAVISFHSLEDRIVKNFFRDESQKGAVKLLTKKPITPTEKEVEENPRSRSGKLRAFEKVQ